METIVMRILNLAVSAGILALVVMVLRFIFLRRMPRWITCILWGMVAVRLLCPISINSSVSMMPNLHVDAIYEETNKAAQRAQSEVAPSDNREIRTQNEVVQNTQNADAQTPISQPQGTQAQNIQSPDAQTQSVQMQDELSQVEQPQGVQMQDELSQDEANNVQTHGAETQAIQTRRAHMSAGMIIAIVWMSGAIIMLGYSFVSFVHLKYRLREAVPENDNVYICDRVESPFLMGIIRPRIYLPSGLQRDAGYELMIAHERAHQRRLDNIWKPLGYLLLCLYWFNPILWIAYRLFCTDIEIACDEKVIGSLSADAKKEYCNALLQYNDSRQFIYSCPLAFGEVSIKERVKNVFHYKKPEFWALVIALLTCVVVAICFLTNRKSDKKTGSEAILQDVDATKDEEQNESMGQNETEKGADSGDSISNADEELTAEQKKEQLAKQGWYTDLQTGRYMLGDLDGNGEEEYIVIDNSDTTISGGALLTVHYNNEEIYRYEDMLWIFGLGEVKSVDLDRDGAKELFCSFYPAVNSMPLTEYFVLDYKGDDEASVETHHGWVPMEMYHDEDPLSNSFPISVTMDKTAPMALIACEGYETKIPFDLEKHFANMRAAYSIGGEYFGSMYEAMAYDYWQMIYRNWRAGAECGWVLPWGIWEIRVSEYEQNPCLVALQGIAGADGKYDDYGDVNIYFDYDQAGEVRILNVTFTDNYANTGTVTDNVYVGSTAGETYAAIAESYYRAGELMKKTGDVNFVQKALGNTYVSTAYLEAVPKRVGAEPMFLISDLNGDGLNELCIGLRYTNGADSPVDYVIYDIFSWQVRDWDETGVAYRLTECLSNGSGICEISSDGHIVEFIHDDNERNVTNIWSLPERGTELMLTDSYCAETVLGDGVAAMKWTHGDKPITEEIYRKDMNQYPYLRINTLPNEPETIDALRKGMFNGVIPQELITRYAHN